MGVIVAQHVLPYVMPKPYTVDTKSLLSIGGPTCGSVFEAVYPVGAQVTTNYNEQKVRLIEQIGDVFLERYGVMTTNDIMNDIDILMTRILDGGSFSKCLINRKGVCRVMPEWRSVDDTSQYIGQTYFVNDLELAGLDFQIDALLHETIHPHLYPDKAMSKYYQNDYSCGINTNINQSFTDHMDYTNHIALTQPSDYAAMHIHVNRDDILCDTGKIRKIDHISWLTKDGYLEKSDLRQSTSGANHWLRTYGDIDTGVPPEELLLLNMDMCYDIVQILAHAPFTEGVLSYILPQRNVASHRSIVLNKQDSWTINRYVNTKQNAATIDMRYADTLGAALLQVLGFVSEIKVCVRWQHDAIITVRSDGAEIHYYVDLTLLPLVTRNLSHL